MMRAEKKPSVLVCVTGQYDCDRLIRIGYEKAREKGCELHILCVHTPDSDLANMSDEIEYLYRTAKELGADMTVIFDKNAPRSAAGFAKKIQAGYLVTGMPDGRPNGFVVLMHELLPKLQITMVTKENERLVYNVYHSDRCYA